MFKSANAHPRDVLAFAKLENFFSKLSFSVYFFEHNRKCLSTKKAVKCL